ATISSTSDDDGGGWESVAMRSITRTSRLLGRNQGNAEPTIPATSIPTTSRPIRRYDGTRFGRVTQRMTTNPTAPAQICPGSLQVMGAPAASLRMSIIDITNSATTI